MKTEPEQITSSVSEKQLRFLSPAKPLSHRFGAAYFKSAPRTPGIYRMFDEADHLIYVGQSKNLRQRLNSYRHVHPDRSSRKLIRLVHAVRRIDWEECGTPVDAQLRENFLIREHRPRFNSMNVWPRSNCFIGIRWTEMEVEFSFTRELPEDDAHFYGSFKSGCLQGYGALLRLLWTVLHQAGSAHELPRQLLADKPPKSFVVDLTKARAVWNPAEKRHLLMQFFHGQSAALLEEIKIRLPSVEESLFQKHFVSADLEKTEDFFRRGPLRNAQLRQKHQIASALIRQEALEDLIIATNNGLEGRSELHDLAQLPGRIKPAQFPERPPLLC